MDLSDLNVLKQDTTNGAGFNEYNYKFFLIE